MCPIFDPNIFDTVIFDTGASPTYVEPSKEVGVLFAALNVTERDFTFIKDFLEAKLEFTQTGNLAKYTVALQKMLADVGEI